MTKRKRKIKHKMIAFRPDRKAELDEIARKSGYDITSEYLYKLATNQIKNNGLLQQDIKEKT